MKKAIYFVIVALMVVALVGCNSNTPAPSSSATVAPSTPAETVAPSAEPQTSGLPADGPTFNFTIGTSATSASLIGQTMQHFADTVNERSGGKIVVQAFPDSQMGSDAELVEGVQAGTVTMVIGTTAPQVSYVPALAIFDLPNAYDNIETAKKALPNFVGELNPSFDGTGLKLCTMFPTAFRFMSSSKAINTVDDFQGIKIRTMQNKYHQAYWNALGATATPLAFSELYVALQQGTVDAQENPLDIFMSSKFFEVQDYIVDTKHIVFVADILMNQAAWDSMPAEYQALMSECFAEASDFGSANAKSVEDTNRQAILDKGVQIIELDDATIAAMKAKAQPVYDMIRTDVGSDLVDKYLAAIEAAK